MKYLCLLILFLISARAESQIAVDTSFEGANAKVLSINNSTNTLKIESVRRRGDIYNVVFYFKVSGFDSTRAFKIQVQYSQLYFVPIQAMYSYDKVTWYRVSGTVSGNYKEFSNTYNRSSIYFCYGYPYVYQNVLDLQSSLSGNQFVSVSNVSVSESGRGVKLFRITDSSVPDSGKSLIWVTGRHHAMETHSNYVVEGLINYLASSDIYAARLRTQAIIYVVPIMDVDMAYVGGTGKDQNPVDFNRDWDSPSYWNAIKDIKTKIIQTSYSNRMRIFLDSHDPFPGDADTTNRNFFYSIYESGPKSVNLNKFRTNLYNAGGYHFGRKPMYTTNGQTSKRWVDSMFTNIDFSVSLETGWTYRTDGAVWSIPLYRYHGAVIGRAMSDYIYQSTPVIGIETPVSFSLNVYPNPFNGGIKFEFTLAKLSDVRLTVCDVTGKDVLKSEMEKLNYGLHTYTFDASGLSSGVYFYRIEAGEIVRSGKIVLLK